MKIRVRKERVRENREMKKKRGDGGRRRKMSLPTSNSCVCPWK